MKKVISFILILICCLSFSACDNEENIQGGNGESTYNNEENVQGGNGEMEIKIAVGGNEFIAKLYENETAKTLADRLPLTIKMNDFSSNEKYYYLPENLPAAAANPVTIQEGDIMLYGANCLVLFYKNFSTSYSYTKIGRIENTAGLTAALGNDSVTITFSIEKN